MLWAAPGTGKTMLALTLALMVAGGGRALGWGAPRPRRVLLVDGEMAAEDLQERLLQLMGTIEGFDPEVAKVNLHLMSRTWQDTSVRFPDLNDRDGRPAQGDKPAQRAARTLCWRRH